MLELFLAILVSIPFIAGQWSLLPDYGPPKTVYLEVSIPFIAGQWSLRPHASHTLSARRRRVSIPFIAGQWSLPGAARAAEVRRFVSIPFIAGQWSLPAALAVWRAAAAEFQSPSLRGSGRFLYPCLIAHLRFLVSIPFIAGQWSLRVLFAMEGCLSVLVFQSPSLRGSGRFTSTTVRQHG